MRNFMNILTVEKITKAYGVRKLFDNASFFLEEGEKAGIIGINGTGKSTLLKMIAGLEEPDEGRVITASHCMVRFLPQNPRFEEDETVLEAVLKGNVSGHNAEELTVEAKRMLTRLGVTDFEQPCGQLSGGQKKRLALVGVLLSPAEILVLDEPTNHLDSGMADWLEETLKNRKGSVVMVTHDRYFLDSVSDRIIEIDKGHIYSYDANYSGYLALKMQREEMALSTGKKRANILRNELEWVKRGARARSTKQKARLERFEELKNVKPVERDGQIQLSSVSSRLGRTTVELHNICKAYGDKKLIDDFTYLFLKDDRVGFVGPNGSGKSTLMKIILGETAPDSGRVETGSTVRIGYYAQEISDDMMNPNERVIDYIRNIAEFVDTDEGRISAAGMLERFLFAGEDQYGLLGKLSGGEKRRLYLCKVLMGAPNVLILDEPTNDLDIATLRILENYLDSFKGIVIVVSHDRYFLDRVVRRTFAFEDGGRIRQYEGGYTDYVKQRPSAQDAQNVRKMHDSQIPQNIKRKEKMTETGDDTAGVDRVASDRNQRGLRKLKFSYKEQREYETIESEITALEEKIEKLNGDMIKFSRDFVKLNEISQEKETSEKLLEEKMNRWMYLEDLAARIENGEKV